MSMASPERPFYVKVEEVHGRTRTFTITVDEGWRVSIVCQGMYEWAADWLVEQIQGQPFAPGYSDREARGQVLIADPYREVQDQG